MPTIETVIAERAETHGDYKEPSAFAQSFKRMMRTSKNWDCLDFYQAQSMEAFCDKMGRILCGNFNEIDHWRDISGYASLVVLELETAQGGALRPEVPNARPPKSSGVNIKPKANDEPLNVPEFILRDMERDIADLSNKKGE